LIASTVSFDVFATTAKCQPTCRILLT
jgi:hypothetical protein